MANHMHDEYDVDSNRWLVPCFLMFDCVIGLCLAGLVYFFGFTDYFEPTSRGFFCDDTSLSMPLPKDEIAPEYTLYTTTLLVPIVIVVIAETCIALKPNSKQQLSLYGQKNIRSCSIHMTTVLRRIIRFTGISLFGGIVTWLVTIGLQFVTGQQTPFFMAACKPDWSLLNCSEFVTNYTCTSSDMDLSRKARMSFPSIHASLSAFSSVFVLIYLNTVGRIRSTRLLSPLFGCGFVSVALLLCASRVSSYRNHWSDVIGGFILGASVAAYLCVSVLRCFFENSDGHSYPVDDMLSFPIMRLPRATVTPTFPVPPTIPTIDYTLA